MANWRKLLAGLIAAAFVVSCAVEPVEQGSEPRDVVVLVHGLLRTSNSMTRLGRRLEDAGYDVAPFDYASTAADVETHGRALRGVLEELAARETVPRVHVVTHSMGGLVARAALEGDCIAKLGRVVMLTPPHSGSPLARVLAPVLSWAVPPLVDLSDAKDSPVRELPIPEGVEFGIIAARYDHAVRNADTHLEGEADHITLGELHSTVLLTRAAADRVVRFLREGRFRTPEEVAAEAADEASTSDGDAVTPG